ncbi:MAG: hypothetical protein IT303_02170 [Dehalococcoidia bacterium]|nr:hypothetical protein [Dehalococcoidia bacterium]
MMNSIEWYAYDNADRLTGIVHDQGGTTLTSVEPRASDSVTWDYEDRMVSATVNSATTPCRRGRRLCRPLAKPVAPCLVGGRSAAQLPPEWRAGPRSYR